MPAGRYSEPHRCRRERSDVRQSAARFGFAAQCEVEVPHGGESAGGPRDFSEGRSCGYARDGRCGGGSCSGGTRSYQEGQSGDRGRGCRGCACRERREEGREEGEKITPWREKPSCAR